MKKFSTKLTWKVSPAFSPSCVLVNVNLIKKGKAQYLFKSGASREDEQEETSLKRRKKYFTVALPTLSTLVEVKIFLLFFSHRVFCLGTTMKVKLKHLPYSMCFYLLHRPKPIAHGSCWHWWCEKRVYTIKPDLSCI